jgi:hypothetical protein
MSLPLLHAGRTNPGLSAALDLRFALDKSLTAYRGPTPSFSRASTGSYFDGSGVLRYAAVNTILQSQTYTNATWTVARGSFTGSSAIAPDGTNTATLFKEDLQTGVHGGVQFNLTSTSGQSATASIYAKAKERSVFVLRFQDNATGANGAAAEFNLSNGTISVSAINSGTFTGATASISSVGNGWYRCSVTSTVSTNLCSYRMELCQTSGTLSPGNFSGGSYAGDNTSGIYWWGSQFEISSTVGTYSPTTSSANSAPRFDHTYNGTSWISRGLLVEEQRTNLQLASSDLGNGSYWSNLNMSISANSGNAPDGTATADFLVPSAGTGTKYIYSNPAPYTKTAGANNAVSIFAKSSDFQYITIQALDNGSGAYIHAGFDLLNGIVGSSATGGGATFVSSSIQNVGNGWYRCVVVGSSSGTQGRIAIGVGGNATLTSTGDGVKGAFIWGVQAEDNVSFPTSYIPTTTASATRSADVCQITGSDFSSFWNASEGSFAFDADGFSTSTNNQFILSASSGSSANSINLVRSNANDVTGVGSSVLNGGGLQEAMNAAAGTWPTGQTCKLAFAYKANDFAQSVNGAAVTTDTSGSIPTVSQMVIGNAGWTTGPLNGHIARLRYYNKRLPNATLQLLSEPDPTLNLQFALNKTLTPVAGPAPSFSRASTGSYFDSTGTLKYANVNLLTYSEQFDNAAWSERVGSTISTNVVASPIGDLTADQLQLTSSGLYYQKKAYTTTGTHTFSVWLRSSSPTTTLLRLSNDAGTENSVVTCNVTTSWQRFSVTRNWSANPVNFYAGLDQRTVVGGPGTSTDVFIWGAQLELASSPSQYAKTEASTTAGPRFDHTYDGTNWISRGLLIEEQRTNLLIRSQEFQTGWTNNDINISANSVTAPDGTLTADNLVPNAVSTNHRLYQGPAGSGAASVSVFAKSTGYGWLQVRVGAGGGTSVTVNFDVVNGVIGNTILAGGATASNQSIENVGNGWWRCKFTTSSVPAFTTVIMPRPDNASVEGQAYAGDGIKGVSVWGAQLETGSFPTSYIGTTSSSVTRSADVCQITGTSFNWMWNQGEGSFVVNYDCPATGTLTQYQANSAVSTNIHTAVSVGTTQYFQVYLPPEQALINAGSITANIPQSLSSAYKLNDFAASLNGASVVVDTSGSLPTPTKIIIGSDGFGYNNGHIAKLIYYPARLTNTKLQQLST